MQKKHFEVNQWLNNIQIKTNQTPQQNTIHDTELIIKRIESQCIDITANYNNWLNIGFALANEYNESGRSYYHRISRFHPNYYVIQCDQQFDKCLKSNGHGINIQTLYYIAKKAGINISSSVKNNIQPHLLKKTNRTNQSEPIFNTPKIPADVYSHLPTILKESADMFKEAVEKDIFLVGAISVLSACLPHIEGTYFNEIYSSHLYSFITAPAGSGKGKLKWAKFFGQEIHNNMIQESKKNRAIYKKELEKYNSISKNNRENTEPPIESKNKMFYIPANSSASAFIQALADNDFKGVIFETEADTLSNTLKQDWGNFNDVLRKAFHHEGTNMFRRKDNEHIEIQDPHLAIILSGTPKQVHNMMPNVENGLFSRFLYYAFEDFSDFKNPFVSHRSTNYIDFFKAQGQTIYHLYQMLNNLKKPIEFYFTTKQGEQFTEKFKSIFNRNKTFLGNNFNANSRRLGLITFRIAMILSALRIIETGDITNPMYCSDIDYQTSINIACTLEQHAIAVYKNMPNIKLKGIKQNFYDLLPGTFNRQKYISIAETLSIKEKTAEKYITQFRKDNLLNHQHNKYTKPINNL